jgi:phosphoribosylglycinamide formyltransferase 1
MGAKLRIGVLVSGGGSNLQAIIDACDNGSLDGQIVFAGSDNPGAGGVERAKTRGIPTFIVDYRRIIKEFKAAAHESVLPADFSMGEIWSKQQFFKGSSPDAKAEYFLKTRALAEAALLEAMQPYPFNLLVLAGFMRTLTPYFIDRINTDPEMPRMMNIHPALLPSFPGIDGYGDTYRYGCKVGGCTVHFIDYGEDTGPIIGQKAFAILPEDTEENIRQKGLKLEWGLYPECIQLFAEGRLQITKKAYSRPKGDPLRRTVVQIIS